MNTHLHLMEALTALYQADPSPRVAMRLSELITIQSNTVVRKAIGACTDQYAADWTPKLDGAAARASYGHDLENIWLLVDALDALGQPVAPLRDLFTQLFAYSLANGYDEAQRRLLRQRAAGPTGRSPRQGVVGAGRSAGQRVDDVPADRRPEVRAGVPEDVGVHRHEADRLDDG